MIIPKAFISYSPNSLEHKKWILELAIQLRNNGFDTILNQFELTSQIIRLLFIYLFIYTFYHIKKSLVHRPAPIISIQFINWASDKLSGQYVYILLAIGPILGLIALLRNKYSWKQSEISN